MIQGPPGPFDPAAIIAALDRHDVAYVLIGGGASVLLGAPTITTDLDVVPQRTDENVHRLVSCLQALEARRVTEPDRPPTAPAVADLRYRIEQFDSPVGPIDVVFEATRIGGYERLADRAERIDVEGSTVLVAALDDLIMGKEWSDRPKDRTHLRLLLAVKRERDREP